MQRKQRWVPIVLLMSVCGVMFTAQTSIAAADEAVKALPVRPGLYMLTVAGNNVAVQTGPDGTIVIDTGPAGTSEALLSAIKKIAPEPIRYVINTSASADRTGGNAPISKAGVGFSRLFLGDYAPIIAQQNVLLTMSNAPKRASAAIFFPQAALPSLTYSGRQKNFSLNGDAIEVIGEVAAHSNGDSVVLFRQSNVVVTGDILDMTRFPVIDVEHGGSIDGEIAALNHLLDLVIPITPLIWQSGATVVIPGRGRLGEQEEVVQYRDMVTIVRDRIRNLINHHETLAQILAADPTAGFTSRYGSDTGDWTTDQFVKAVYQSLTAARKRS